MILVDTSVWVDHLRHGDSTLAALLNNGEVLCHPFIIGELACGNLNKRGLILALLNDLPTAIKANDIEVMNFIESAKLMGRGIGWVDVHLLAATRLCSGKLWTKDKRLAVAAQDLGIGFTI